MPSKLIHFGGPPLTIHVGYCGAPATPDDLSGNLPGNQSPLDDSDLEVTCPDCIGKVRKFESEVERYDDDAEDGVPI